MTQEEQNSLKVGDIIIQMQQCCHNIAGHKYVLGKKNGKLYALTDSDGNDLENPCACKDKWKLANPKPSLIKTIMKTLNNMEKLLLDPDTQKLKKAGLINGDLEITEAGKQELDFINFKAQKAELVKRAEEIIAEKEAEEKKS